MAIPKREPRETDRLVAHFKKELANENMADRNLHEKLANRVVGVKWQTLPYTTEVIQGMKQGARDTYWVNPAGRMVHIGHAGSYNWNGDAKFIAAGPWMQISKESVAEVFEVERSRVALAEEKAREAVKELAELREKMMTVLGIEEDY